jgi:hypothetical protein
LKENVMTMKVKWRVAMVPVLFAAALAWGSARADDVPLISGQQWTQSTEQVKKVYLIGLANVMQVETAYHAAKPPADDQSIVPRFARGLKGQTLDSVRDALDRWYAANPDKLQRPVIETIWFEMVVPGLKASK